MNIHPWWTVFGQAVSGAENLKLRDAQIFAAALSGGLLPGISLVGLKRAENGAEALCVEVEVERPQDFALPIKAVEPLAILFSAEGEQPRILALREDFPDTYHQNWTPPETPFSLCVDDRPWPEIKLTFTPADLVRRTQLWLAKAARGELHDRAQPLEPLFFTSPISLVVPSDVFSNDPVELTGYFRQDNDRIIITRKISENAGAMPNGIIALTFQAAPQSMSRLRHAPATLGALAEELRPGGIDLLTEIRQRVKSWSGLQGDNLRRIWSRIVVIVSFPITSEDGRIANDLRAFVTSDIAGDIGVALGVLGKNSSGIGNQGAYLSLVSTQENKNGDDIIIQPTEVYPAFSRDIAAAIAGHKEIDRRKVVLVGAGALGSQIAMNLAREGSFSWTVLDKDFLFPHNLARHALSTTDVGAPKAAALARQIQAILGENAEYFICDVMTPPADARAKIMEADIIIDASASVAVSRYIADLADTKARRISTFLNPAGTSLILLCEGRGREVTLHDLEAQYHDALLSESSLEDHLKIENSGLRYSGSCRSLTNRIPASRAALLSAIAARGINRALKQDDAEICIWTITDDEEVTLYRQTAANVTRVSFGAWTVVYNEKILQSLSAYREQRLPNETGGVLLGIVDVSRRTIHVAHALPQPSDSRGSIVGFERGVAGLREAVELAVKKSMHQLRYVGEWHSHPRGSSACPSGIDLRQLAWLSGELENEGLPALMAIAADNGSFSFMLGSAASEIIEDTVTLKKRRGK